MKLTYKYEITTYLQYAWTHTQSCLAYRSRCNTLRQRGLPLYCCVELKQKTQKTWVRSRDSCYFYIWACSELKSPSSINLLNRHLLVGKNQPDFKMQQRHCDQCLPGAFRQTGDQVMEGFSALRSRSYWEAFIGAGGIRVLLLWSILWHLLGLHIIVVK